MKRVLFVGTGAMGSRMAVNLASRVGTLFVFDANKSAARAVAALAGNVEVVPSIAAGAARAESVVSCLPGCEAVRFAFLGQDGIVAHAREGATLVDCSTVAAATSRAIAEAAETRALHCVDAPMSGGVRGAEAGTLAFMVGGALASLERARPLLASMGANVHHAGVAPGSGQIAKACNNMLLACSMIATSEALQLGAAHGLDPAALSAILQSASGQNWVLDRYNPAPGVDPSTPASNGYHGGFSTALCAKDLALALAAASAVGARLPLATIAGAEYDAHARMRAHDDFSSIFDAVGPPR